jgi:hypothetical protein
MKLKLNYLYPKPAKCRMRNEATIRPTALKKVLLFQGYRTLREAVMDEYGVLEA